MSYTLILLIEAGLKLGNYSGCKLARFIHT